MKVMMVNYTMDAKMFIKLLNAEIVMKLFEFSDNESSDDEGSGSDCEDDECKKRKKKVHRLHKRGGYGSERRQSDCESDCRRSDVATIHSVNFMKIIVICFLLYVMVFYMMIDMPLGNCC